MSALQDSLHGTDYRVALLSQEDTALHHTRSPKCSGSLLRGSLAITTTGLPPVSHQDLSRRTIRMLWGCSRAASSRTTRSTPASMPRVTSSRARPPWQPRLLRFPTARAVAPGSPPPDSLGARRITRGHRWATTSAFAAATNQHERRAPTTARTTPARARHRCARITPNPTHQEPSYTSRITHYRSPAARARQR